jgi:RNA polymerase sigma factor (sigma-70 family)
MVAGAAGVAGGEEANDAPSPRTAEVVRTLVENHRAFLGFLERRVGDRALAEDILQEAFARGIGKVSALESDESAVAWFYRSLRNAVVDHHRRHRTAEKALQALADELGPDQEPSAELQGAVCQCVARLAGTLKPEYAEALRRIEVDGVPVHAFAVEQGITSGNAAVRVFRAREALRRQVVAACGTCAEHGCFQCTCAGEPASSGDEGRKGGPSGGCGKQPKTAV